MNKMGKKIAVDLYGIQMKWVAWCLPIVYVFYFVTVWFLDEPEIKSMSLLAFTFQSATIFIFICGILSSLTFLPMYIKLGVTRKSYFQGAILSSIGLAITIISITAIVTWLISLAKMNVFKDMVLSTYEVNGWLVTIISYIIVITIYFIAGWLVGIGFYRYGGIGGFVSIVVATVIISLNGLLWAFSTPRPIMGLFSLNIPVPPVAIAIAIVGSILIASLSAILVYKIVKETPIKIA